MKDQDPQEQGPPIGDLIADLLRDRLASKLPESELTTLISDTKEIVEKTTQPKADTAKGTEEAQTESQVDKLKSSIDYIEYKCREIERSLRASDRHVRPRERRDRIFRDRSPLGISFDDSPMYGGLRPATRPLTITRSPAALIRHSHIPRFDSYFS